MPLSPPKKKNQWVQLFADNAIYEPRNLLGFSNTAGSTQGSHPFVLKKLALQDFSP